MSINTITSPLKHVESTIQKLRKDNKLAFTEVLSPEDFIEKMQDVPYRARIFSPDLTVFTFLSQVLSADQTCQSAVAQAIAHLISQGKNPPSPNTSAYCQARARLPEKLLSDLTIDTADKLEKQAKPEWLWRNRPVKMPDGTSVSMPDTAANQAIYPQPCTQKKGLVFPELD